MAHDSTDRVTNKRKAPAERRLALEIRSWQLGYAVLESDALLDWGTCRFPPGEPGSAVRRIGFLVRTYAPALVVARTPRRAKDASSRYAARVLRKIRNDLERQLIRFALVTREAVRDYFAGLGCGNKHEIAAAIAEHIPQLRARVPHVRKPWDPEEAIVAVFDGIATSMALGNDTHMK